MSSKHNKIINICMLISIILVSVLTFFPTFCIDISTGTELGGAKSTLNFSMTSVTATDNTHLLGENSIKKQNITLTDAFKRLEIFTTDEYCVADMYGLVDSMSVVFITSIVLIALYIIALLLVITTDLSIKPFICPYGLIIHCILIALVPIIVSISYNTTKIPLSPAVVSISLTPFTIIAICISALSSIAYLVVKIREKQ